MCGAPAFVRADLSAYIWWHPAPIPRAPSRPSTAAAAAAAAGSGGHGGGGGGWRVGPPEELGTAAGAPAWRLVPREYGGGGGESGEGGEGDGQSEEEGGGSGSGSGAGEEEVVVEQRE